jgi:hypothetical protein
MSLVVHYQPVSSGSLWNLHAWQLAWDGNDLWDPAGTVAGSLVDFPFPDVPDPRKLNFKFRSLAPATGAAAWESDDFIRQIVDPGATEVWTFPGTRRVLARDPNPPGTLFQPGDALTFRVITQSSSVAEASTPGTLTARRRRRASFPSLRATMRQASPRSSSPWPTG